MGEELETKPQNEGMKDSIWVDGKTVRWMYSENRAGFIL